MPLEHATANGAAKIAARLLEYRLHAVREEAVRADEDGACENERTALAAAEWGMAYGYFKAKLEASA